MYHQSSDAFSTLSVAPSQAGGGSAATDVAACGFAEKLNAGCALVEKRAVGANPNGAVKVGKEDARYGPSGGGPRKYGAVPAEPDTW